MVILTVSVVGRSPTSRIGGSSYYVCGLLSHIALIRCQMGTNPGIGLIPDLPRMSGYAQLILILTVHTSEIHVCNFHATQKKLSHIRSVQDYNIELQRASTMYTFHLPPVLSVAYCRPPNTLIHIGDKHR